MQKLSSSLELDRASPLSPPQAVATPVCSTTFARLLSDLRAEHEREVGILLAENQTLRASLGRRDGGSTVAADVTVDGLDAVGACVPFLCSLKFRPVGRSMFQCLQAPPRHQSAAQVLPTLTPIMPMPSKDLAASWEPKAREVASPPVPSQEAPAAKEVAIRSPTTSPVQRQAPGEGLRRGRTRGQMLSDKRPRKDWGSVEEGSLWPVWESALPVNREGRHGETWLEEAMHRRTTNRSTGRTASSLAGGNALKSSCPLSPTSTVKMVWDFVAPFTLLYDIIAIPMQAFSFPEPMWQQTLESVILVYWVLDMFVAFNSAYFNRKGEVVTNYRKIVWTYLSTWFVPDLLVTGLDVVTTVLMRMLQDGSASETVDNARMFKFLRIARIVRVMRLGRVAKLRETIYGIQVYFDSEAVAIVWGLIGNVCILLMLNHINACLWFTVGTMDWEYTWVKSTRYQGPHTFAEADRWDQYFASLHWSLALFTPAGMSVQPKNVFERIYAVVSLLPGLIIFASFISTVTAGMSRLRQIQQEGLEQGFTLRKFLQENDISKDLVTRVTRYVDIAMKSHKKRIPKEDVARLKWLSGPLKMELMWELSAPTMKTHVFFERYGACSVAAMRQLCFSAVQSHSVSTKDTVFSSFEHAWCIYHVKSGSLVYKPAAGLDFPRRVTVEEGDWFVEPVLWLRWVHRGTMKALTDGDLMSVDAEKFRQVSSDHPDVLASCSEYAFAFLRKCSGRDTCDVPLDIFDRQSQQRLNHHKEASSFWHAGRHGHESAEDVAFSSDEEEEEEGLHEVNASNP